MDPHTGTGTPPLSTAEPTRSSTPSAQGPTRPRLRPTWTGWILGILIVVGAAVRPDVAEPAVAALIWAGLVGMFGVGLLWPLAAMRSPKIQVLDAPSDLVVDAPGRIEVVLERPGLPVVIQLDRRIGGFSTGGRTSPRSKGGSDCRQLTLTVTRRGVYTQLPVWIACEAPFGLFRVTRCVVADLHRTLWVGPRSSDERVLATEMGSGSETPVTPGHGTGGDTVRAVRPYTPGDPAHLVHWPSSARAGALVVRELEPPPSRVVAIVVDLGAAPGPDTETVVSSAAGAAESALLQGSRVLLCTAEDSGAVSGELTTDLALRRRLAAAVPGPPGVPPPGWPVMTFSSRQPLSSKHSGKRNL